LIDTNLKKLIEVQAKKSTRLLFAVACSLLIANSCYGQIELSSGIDLSYPVLINSTNAKLNYGQISFGLRFGIAYKPAETQFFPILTTAFGRTRLPLQQFGQNVIFCGYDYLNVMLNENYIVRFPMSELFVYGGIGFTDLTRKAPGVAGPGGQTMQVTVDSVKYQSNVFPAMNIGFEYNYGESAGKDLYLTMGLNFQYILLFAERNTYYLTVDERYGVVNNYKTTLTGGIIAPGFYIAIHYLLHVHKKSGMYL
jgi:hypothetical protein